MFSTYSQAGHHQIPLSDFRMVMKACTPTMDQPDFLVGGNDDICKAALAKTKKEIGGFFAYALYDECTYRHGLKWKAQVGLLTEDDDHHLQKLKGALNDYPCATRT